MRLSTKLLISFISIALLVLLTGGLSYYFSIGLKNSLVEEGKVNTERLKHVTSMSIELQNTLLYTKNYLAETEKKKQGDESLATSSQIRKSKTVTNESLRKFRFHLDSLQELNNSSITENDLDSDNYDKLNDLSDTLRTTFLFYESVVNELFESELEDDYGDEIFNVTVEPYFRNTILPLLNDIRNETERSVSQINNLQSERADHTIRQIFIVAGLSFLAAIILAFINYKSISKPLNNLSTVANEMGRGNLDIRVKLNTKDELSQLADSLNTMAKNLSDTMVSRDYVDSIIQSMGEMLFVLDKNGQIEMCNKAAVNGLEYSENDLNGQPIWNFIESKDADRIRKYAINESDKSVILESRFKKKKGGILPAIYTSTIIKTSRNGGLKRVVVASDITAQIESKQKISESLAEKNVLLSEIHHRVKNNLAVISGLLQMQVWDLKSDEAIGALQQSQLRIQSIALVHEKLYQTNDFASIDVPQYVEELVEAIRKTYFSTSGKVEVNYHQEELSMTLNQAIPFSLLVNEVVTNTFKHAFTNQDKGIMDVELKINGEKIEFTIKDNGKGLPEDFEEKSKKSLGMSLISILNQQLNGDYTFKNRNDKTGVQFTMRFPRKFKD